MDDKGEPGISNLNTAEVSEVTLPESGSSEEFYSKSTIGSENRKEDGFVGTDTTDINRLSVEGGPSENQRRKSKYSVEGIGDNFANKYGLFSSVAVIICTVIGAGIFINPQEIYKGTSSTGISLIIWFSMGLHVTIGALCYAELGTTLPLSGGDYAYLCESFGPFIGFQYQWCANLLFIPGVNAILARTIGRYLLKLICIYSSCKEISDRDTLDLYASLIGFGFVVFITTVNCLNGKFAERMQNTLMVAKLSACSMVIILGIIQLSQPGEQGSKFDFSTSSNSEGFIKDAYEISYAVYEVSFSYLGWTYLNFITEELENPYRNLPIAIVLSMLLITAIYIFMNVAYFAILTDVQLRATTEIASDALNDVLGTGLELQLGWIMPIIVMISAFGGLAAHMMASSRLTFVGARQRQLPKALNQIHVSRHTPIPALLLQAIMTTIYLAVQNVVTVILMSVYCENFFSSLAVVALLYLRYKKPELNRPIKLFIGVPIFYIVVSFVIFIIPIVGTIIDTSEEHLASGIVTVTGPIGIFLFGIPAYLYFIRHPKCMANWPTWLYSPECQQRADDKLESCVGKALNLKPEHHHEGQDELDQQFDPESTFTLIAHNINV